MRGSEMLHCRLHFFKLSQTIQRSWIIFQAQEDHWDLDRTVCFKNQKVKQKKPSEHLIDLCLGYFFCLFLMLLILCNIPHCVWAVAGESKEAANRCWLTQLHLGTMLFKLCLTDWLPVCVGVPVIWVYCYIHICRKRIERLKHFCHVVDVR